MKKRAPKPRSSSWTSTLHGEANGRHFQRGDELSVRDHNGRRARVRFLEWVTTPTSEWINVGEPMEKGHSARHTRSFDPSKILTVHTKPKLAASKAEKKETS